MRTKKSFITDPEVYRVASELQSCLKICHKTYIGWTVLVNYLWKNEEGEIRLYAGDIVSKVGETIKDGVLRPVFAAYGVRRLKPE